MVRYTIYRVLILYFLFLSIMTQKNIPTIHTGYIKSPTNPKIMFLIKLDGKIQATNNAKNTTSHTALARIFIGFLAGFSLTSRDFFSTFSFFSGFLLKDDLYIAIILPLYNYTKIIKKLKRFFTFSEI